jgi:hypothetical protein
VIAYTATPPTGTRRPELAAGLDLHPADLIPALDRVLVNRRQPPAAADHDTSRH